MAGKDAHRERSHRSYKNKIVVFGRFVEQAQRTNYLRCVHTRKTETVPVEEKELEKQSN